MSVIALDLGTSLCKVEAFSRVGKQLASCSEEIPTTHPKPDWAEQDPEDWWRAVQKCVKAIRGDLPREDKAGAIVPCSHRESITGVNSRGEAICPCMLWADRRCEKEAVELAGVFGPDLHQRTGMKADPYFTAPKLLWLSRHEPGLMAQVKKFLLPKDFLIFKLTGSYATDWSVASRTAMLDIRARAWWSEMLEHVGVDQSQLCDPISSAEPVGRLKDVVGRRLGLPAKCMVYAGAGDRQCEAMASGVSPTSAMESTGSATNISISTGSLPGRLVGGLLYSCHAVEGHFLVEQGIGSTGMALRWFRDSLRPPEDDEKFRQDPYAFIDGEAAKSPAGSNGLVFLPFMMGAQATRWNPSARGVLFGLTLGHGYGDIARSILEGVAYEIRAAIELLNREGMDPESIVALGGSARSDLWNQIKADITGRVYTRPEATGASRGAMLLALDREDPIDPGPKKIYNPDSANAETYRIGYSRYERIYRSCLSVFSES